MLAQSLKKKKSPKKLSTPKSEKVARKRKNSDDLTQQDITDLLGIKPSTPKDVKKNKLLTSPSTEPLKKKKKSLEKSETTLVQTAPSSQKKKRKANDKEQEEENKTDKKSEKPIINKNNQKTKKSKKKKTEEKNEEVSEKEVETERLKELKAKQDKRKAEDDKKHLFISGFNDKATEADLKKLSPDILDATIKRTFLKKNQGGTKCYAYVKFDSESSVERNIEKLKGKKLKGCELEVDYVGAKSRKFKEKSQKDAPKVSEFDAKRLYVTGFNKETINDDKLKAVFEGCKEVLVARKRKDQCAIGYAFIGFDKEEVSRGFFEKGDSIEIDGFKLNVCFARKKIK